MNWILLTGATGFVGRHVLQELLNNGHRVAVLLRDKGTTGTAQRWFDVLSKIPANQLDKVTPIYGDLFDLESVRIFSKVEHICCVVHCAADVSFGSGTDPRLTNVQGLRSLLEMMEQSEITNLHHVSTAYVCGKCLGSTFNENQLSTGQSFRNLYERSKFIGELSVAKFKRKDLDVVRSVTVYRPTIVVGDSVSGVSSCFNGFYHLIRILNKVQKLKQMLGTDIGEVRVALDGGEIVNLVPVDYVARVIAKVVKDPALQGKTYHVTPSLPLRSRFILKELVRYFGESNLPRINFVGKGYWNNASVAPPNMVEEDIPKWLGCYEPYFGTDPYFDTTNTDKAMGQLYVLDRQRWLQAVIDYAVRSNFGRRTI